MKYFWVVFGIYIIILSATPCKDEETCNTSKTSQESKKHDSQNEHKNEACSPFCQCNCCGSGGFKFETFSSALATPYQPIQDKILSFQSLFVSQFVAKIWQPPKIA